jgi:hypothetical protein
MGSRNADRISIVEWRAKVETVEQMFMAGWRVQAHCYACNLTLDVDLARVGTLRGPDTVLWDRDAGCRRHGCEGRMKFQAKVPGTYTYQALAGHPVKREPAWKRGREGS